MRVSFEPFDLTTPGYQRFALESLNKAGEPIGDLEALILTGPAAEEAHFNLKPRRNAASVHLAYPVPEETKVEAFYCELTALEDPLWSYYMACGWNRGYFGMQVNSPTERRIIFSVWDSGSKAMDRSKVDAENRVTLVAKGEQVDAGDFGNEGTGGHSHLVFPWKTGEKQRFIVTAKVTDATHTIYSGYYFHPVKKQWVLISSWRAPKAGNYLRGLYSFSENFGGDNGHLRRKALYGNQWFAQLTASGSNWQLRASVTTRPVRPTASTVSWASRTASFSCRRAALFPASRNSVRNLPVRPPARRLRTWCCRHCPDETDPQLECYYAKADHPHELLFLDLGMRPRGGAGRGGGCLRPTLTGSHGSSSRGDLATPTVARGEHLVGI